MASGRDLELCPFAPEIEIACVFENISDISTADAAGNFKQIEFAVPSIAKIQRGKPRGCIEGYRELLG